MADVTGGTPPTNASPFAVPADFKAVYDHFGDSSQFTVADTSSLPASNNWVGRRLFVQSVGLDYVCSALPGTWRRQGVYAELRGSVSCASSGVTTVTFSTAFAVVPVLEVSVYNNTVVSIPHVTNLTASGFEIRVFAFDGNQRAGTVKWVASQATASSATG
jgi:hypothetical protein